MRPEIIKPSFTSSTLPLKQWVIYKFKYNKANSKIQNDENFHFIFAHNKQPN